MSSVATIVSNAEAGRTSPTRQPAARVQAYEERLLSMLQMNLTCPFATEVLGTAVSVERIDLNAADEIVAVCRRGRQRQLIPILDLRLLSPRPAGWEWIEAYRYWARGGR